MRSNTTKDSIDTPANAPENRAMKSLTVVAFGLMFLAGAFWLLNHAVSLSGVL
jgi:hypothetical protein